MPRPRLAAAFALASYLLAVIASPVLHRLHHAQHGADHEHTALGTIYSHTDEGAQHAAFDTVLVELGLAEVATAGTLTVDCAYTDYTLATCDATATASHPRTFGDDLLAREHQHRGIDPSHGAGSIEHLASSLLATPITILPPPHVAVQRVLLAYVVTPSPSLDRARPSARGPPSV